MKTVLNLGQMLTAHARLSPDRMGARDLERSMTFRQWNARACRLANALLGLGLSKGDRVAILAYNAVSGRRSMPRPRKRVWSPCRSISVWSARRSATLSTTAEAAALIVQDQLVGRG